jgi:hypothetical protein
VELRFLPETLTLVARIATIYYPNEKELMEINRQVLDVLERPVLIPPSFGLLVCGYSKQNKIQKSNYRIYCKLKENKELLEDPELIKRLVLIFSGLSRQPI